MALHTSPNCKVSGQNQLGAFQSDNCDTTINFNSGCGTTAATSNTYGEGFNGAGGGVFATEWTSEYIRIWHFQFGLVPQDIIDGNPDPSTWGLPQANFQGDCVIYDHFADHKIIFDTTFCGDWAGNQFASDQICGLLAGGSCKDYVANNPKDFIDTYVPFFLHIPLQLVRPANKRIRSYWAINSVKVYKQPEIEIVSSTQVTTPITSTTPITKGSAIFSPTTSVPILPTLSDVIPQSFVLAPGMGGSTSISYSGAQAIPSNPTSAPYVIPTDPAQAGTFKFLGCASSTSAFAGFTQVKASPLMTVDRCTASCGSYAFAGTFNTMCFCANTLDNATGLVDVGRCDIPCPGNAAQACGGSAQPQLKRQASNQILLSVYANEALQPLLINEALQPLLITATPTASPQMPQSNVLGYGTANTQTPQSSVLGYGLGGGVDAAAIVNIVLSAVYVDVCTGCPGGLETLTTCVTIEDCGCRHGSPATATIPMTTLEKACDSCLNGGAGTVTVTVPVVQTVEAARMASILPVLQTVEAVKTASILPVVAAAFPTRASNATASVAVFTGAAQRAVGAEQAVAALVGVVALAMF